MYGHRTHSLHAINAGVDGRYILNFLIIQSVLDNRSGHVRGDRGGNVVACPILNDTKSAG